MYSRNKSILRLLLLFVLHSSSSVFAWTGTGLCRSPVSFLPPELYAPATCALCYKYMQNEPWIFHAGEKWKGPVPREDGRLVLVNSLNATEWIEANASDPLSPLISSFVSEDWRAKWEECCKAAERCCDKMVKINYTDSPEYCPATWDAWQCWDATRAGSEASAPCPSYIRFAGDTASCERYATKRCQMNGTWFRNIEGREWSNYTTCGAIEQMSKRTYVHLGAYTISIVALVPALFIFFSYKQLKVHRIIMHKNLFASILINCIVVITFQKVVILNELQTSGQAKSITAQNGVGCKVLFILTKYSRLTNYMWMFCEGFYLHRLIAAAFAEQKSLVVFYVIGWVFPAIPTIIYAILRATKADTLCWVVPVEAYEWVLNLPSLLSLVVNIIFLVNIIRVLVTKLRAAQAQEPSQYRKAVRATLVLVPLFGLHFMVTIYRPKTGTCKWIEFYYYTNYLLDGLQGFLVAMIFCYLNGEVHYLMRRTYTRFVERHYPQSSRRSGCRGGSIFLGKSTVSTHCSFMDHSPGRRASHMSLSTLPVATTPPVTLTVNSPTSSGHSGSAVTTTLIMANGSPCTDKDKENEPDYL